MLHQEGVTFLVAPWLKKYLGFKDAISDSIVEKEWKRRTEHICKPCWELKYCPYGPLVEQFPLSEDENAKAIELGWYSRLVKGKGWVRCSKGDRGASPDINRVFEEFGSLNKHSCDIFGHICPVFFVNEPLTETRELRRVNRGIPRKMFLRIVRRDNQTCQICGKNLKEEEIEVDHVIPFSEGGPTEEGNLRVLCKDCNRRKRASVRM
jgi:hypothetical protein